MTEAAGAAFGCWIRSGRRGAAAIETKFNPWHDPEDGRFTFAGSGRNYGGRTGGVSDDGGGGGGGDFGGGGASGSWGSGPSTIGREHGRDGAAPPRGANDRTRRDGASSGRTAPRHAPSSTRPGILGREAWAGGRTVEKWRLISKNGYDFRIDAKDRTREVSGTLTMNPLQARSRQAQANAGGAERRSTDHGGHYIARRFNGPTEAFNHFAQDARFNTGAYRALEDRWAKSPRRGRRFSSTLFPIIRKIL